jgi:proteic killer suppression protein
LPLLTVDVIIGAVIKSFADKDTARVFAREYVRRLAPALHAVAWRKLAQLHAATRLDSLRLPPGNRLEALKGDRVGQYSIRINDQWRICFRWQSGDAYEVEITDYH